jgi:hypothetical protein
MSDTTADDPYQALKEAAEKVVAMGERAKLRIQKELGPWADFWEVAHPTAILALLAERERLEASARYAMRLATRVDKLEAALRKSEERGGKLEKALTPSAETKAAYIGEFGFNRTYVGEDGNDVVENQAVPWTTIKKIMAAIRARATLTKEATDD